MLVDRALTELAEDFPDIEVERIDVLAHPRKALGDGIMMIPALKHNDQKLSGILLSKKEIRQFLEGIS